MKVFKTIYLITIITITVLVVGLFSARRFGKWFGIFNGTKVVETRVDLEPFQSIKLDADVADFTIVEADGYSAAYKYPEKYTINGKVENGVLNIKVKGNDAFYLNFDNAGIRPADTKLTVYVPEGTKLDSIDLEINAGNITISDRIIDSVKVDCDAANLELSEITSDKVNVKADAGNVEISDSVFGDTQIDTSAGRVSLKDTSLGDLTVKTNMGDVNLDKVIFKKGSVNSNLGEVDVNGDFEELKVDNNMGAINVDNEKIADAKVELSIDLGEIVVNGDNKGTSYKQQ